MVTTHQSQDVSQLTPELTVEIRKIEVMDKLERDKLAAMKDIEAEKLKMERYKAKLQAVAIGIPLFVAVVTLVLTFIINTIQSRAQFEMKTAELIMKEDDPYKARSRAQVLARMFPDSLSKVNLDFDLEPYAVHPEDDGMKFKLLGLIVDHYDQKDQIVDDYVRLFPDDMWTKRFRDQKPK